MSVQIGNSEWSIRVLPGILFSEGNQTHVVCHHDHRVIDISSDLTKERVAELAIDAAAQIAVKASQCQPSSSDLLILHESAVPLVPLIAGPND